MSNQILIYGYGREGKSTEAFLHRHHYPEVIDIYDVKTHPIALEWDKYDQIWLSPGIFPSQIPGPHQHKITSQAEYFFSNLPEPERQKVIAVTGSKGKTTTTTALTHFLQSLNLKVECAGNIGIPLLEAINKLQHNELDYLVAEISSFQAERITRSPHTVIFLNIFPDHLDRHGDEASYFQAKANLWNTQQKGDHFIVPETTAKKTQTNHKPVLAKPLKIKLSSVLDAPHFRENLGTIPVLADALSIKFTDSQLIKALESTPLPPHRLEFLAEVNGMKFYDDAIATNPTATIAAVKYFGNQLGVLILGGKSSEADPTELIRTIETTAPKTKIIVTKSNFSTELKNIKTTLDIAEVSDLAAAFPIILNTKPTGPVVLLSPAAKSFDQYPSYVVKGEHFKTLVNTLATKS